MMVNEMRKFSIAVFIVLCLVPNFANAGKLEDIFAVAQQAYKENRLDDAATEFGRVAQLLVSSKQYPQARLILGNVAAIQIRQEKYADAVSTYEKALKLPGKPDKNFQLKAWQNLAVCHHHLKQYALQAQYLEQLLKILPKQAKNLYDLYAQLGDAYKSLECYSLASKAYAKATDLMPKDGDKEQRRRILVGHGLCVGNLGDFPLAEKLLYESLAGVEEGNALTNAESFSNLGIIKWEQGDYPNAVDLLEKSLEIEKAFNLKRNEGVDSNNYGLVLKSAGRYEDSQQWFDKAMTIAREVDNVKDEAIALANSALVARIMGNFEEAKSKYTTSLDLYEKAGFQEGKASTLLGLGKIYEVGDNNYAQAIACYRQAYDIYEKLEMPRGIAESLNQLGRALKKTSTPQRTTRGLNFDDEEITFPELDPAEAREESVNAYTRVLEIAEPLGLRELIWSAYQGLGSALRESGKKLEALEQYEKAIAIVTLMRSAKSNVELLGEYMKDKGDLFTEAMELCNDLYAETKDQKYMIRALELDEILRNEIIKANTQLVQLNYVDPNKKELYKNMLDVPSQGDKALSAMPFVPKKTEKKQAKKVEIATEQDRQDALKAQEADAIQKKVKKLDDDYKNLLAEWKKRYPEDAALFDSSAKIDPVSIQKSLAPDELVLNYVTLTDNLVIVAIAKEFIHIYSEPVSKEKIDEWMKKDFLTNIIEKYGNTQNEQKTSTAFLRNMYKILLEPVEKDMDGKDKLTIVASGFLAQFPFAAAVVDASDPLFPTYLIESKQIQLSRLSFFKNGHDFDVKIEDSPTMIAAGNPRNKKCEVFNDLPGAKEEIQNVAHSLGLPEPSDSIKYEHNATETWIKNAIANDSPSILYFATHGMPSSDTYCYDLKWKKHDEKEAKKIGVDRSSIENDPKQKGKGRLSVRYMREKLSPINSMLNGYLYMAESDPESDQQAESDPYAYDGFLTIKEIMAFDKSFFEKTKIAILSACNTGVKFVPKSFSSEENVEQALQSEEREKELRKAGWTPGVDQISFVDTFMKQGVDKLYGTLWFVDDKASAYIMPRFIEKTKTEPILAAYTDTIRNYLQEAKQKIKNKPCICILGKKEENPEENYTDIPQHPYYWAVGAIFGH